jgi:hypothetical protein
MEGDVNPALSLGKTVPVLNGYEAGWAPEPVARCEGEKNLVPVENRTAAPRPSSPLPVAISRKLSRLS